MDISWQRLGSLGRRLIPLGTTLVVGLSGLTLVVLPRLLDPAVMPDPEVGKLVEQDIRAPRALDIVDQETTDWMTKDASLRVRSVYDHDAQLPWASELRLSEAFAFIRQQDSMEEARGDFYRLLGTTLEAEDFADAKARRFDPQLEQLIAECLRAAYPSFVVSDRQVLLPDVDKGITLRHFNVTSDQSGVKEEVLADVSDLRDLTIARADMASRLRDVPGLTRNHRRLVLAIATRLLKPNIVFNRDETERRKQAASDDIKPRFIPVQQGELIAKKGDRLSRRQTLILKAFYAQAQKTSSTPRAVGTTLMLAIFALASLRFSRSLSKRPLSVRDSVFAIGVLVMQMLLVRALNYGLSYWDPSFAAPYEALLWAAPFAAGALLVRRFLATEVGLVVGMVSAVAAALMFENNLVLLLYVLSGTLVAATPTRKRNRLWQIGLEIALAQVLVVACHLILSERFHQNELIWAVPAALVSGALSVLFCAILSPVLEALLGFTTEGRLKELTSLNHPLLKQLIVAAPGTYHHSVVMGQMVEAAALALGANHLLAKVGAYFHDIGKLEAPQVYAENRRSGKTGMLSDDEYKAIQKHADAGIRVARAARLGSAVIEIIAAHHGSRPLGMAPANVRYEGPKPRSREAALVMIADAVEAGARDLDLHTYQDIGKLIDDVVSLLFQQGQLGESELQLRELPLVRAAFVRTLVEIRRAEDGHKLWVVHDASGEREGVNTEPAQDNVTPFRRDDS